MPEWFKFISLRSHRETIAAKDETIALLRETVTQLTSSLEAFREAMVALRTPQARAPRPAHEREPSKPIDYANLDPNDWTGILQAATSELGPSAKISAHHLQQRAEQIKRQILAHRTYQHAKAMDPSVSLPDAPRANTPADVEMLINQAISEGEAQGRAN